MQVLQILKKDFSVVRNNQLQELLETRHLVIKLNWQYCDEISHSCKNPFLSYRAKFNFKLFKDNSKNNQPNLKIRAWVSAELSHQLAVQISYSYIAPFLRSSANIQTNPHIPSMYRRRAFLYCLDGSWGAVNPIELL